MYICCAPFPSIDQSMYKFLCVKIWMGSMYVVLRITTSFKTCPWIPYASKKHWKQTVPNFMCFSCLARASGVQTSVYRAVFHQKARCINEKHCVKIQTRGVRCCVLASSKTLLNYCTLWWTVARYLKSVPWNALSCVLLPLCSKSTSALSMSNIESLLVYKR